MRKGTKAKIERQTRALARFGMIVERDWRTACRPHTNIKRFADEDAFAGYFARKIREKSSLKVRLRHAARHGA